MKVYNNMSDLKKYVSERKLERLLTIHIIFLIVCLFGFGFAIGYFFGV